jgi:hypothetical protein
MRLSPLLLGAMLLTPGASARAQVSSSATDQVSQRERDMWRYVKDQTFAPFRAAVDSANYSAIYFDGVREMPVDVAGYEWTSLERYQLSNMVARQVDSQMVLVTYKAVLKGKSLGANVAGTFWMASLWHWKNGEWLAVFHSEVKAP